MGVKKKLRQYKWKYTYKDNSRKLFIMHLFRKKLVYRICNTCKTEHHLTLEMNEERKEKSIKVVQAQYQSL